MTRSLLSLLGSATLLLGTTPLIHAQSSGVPNNAVDLSAEDILNRALERAAVQDEEGLELTFEYFVESTAEKLDDEGVVTETTTAKFHQYPLEELLYEALIESDGEPLDEDELREQHKRKMQFVREAREHREVVGDTGDDDDEKADESALATRPRNKGPMRGPDRTSRDRRLLPGIATERGHSPALACPAWPPRGRT